MIPPSMRNIFFIALGAYAIPSWSKPTHNPNPPTPKEVAIQIVRSPRAAADFDATLMLEPGVQSCLAAAFSQNQGAFKAEIKGFVSKAGGLSKLELRSAQVPLKDCLKQKIGAINLGPGDQGRFHFKVFSPPKGEGKFKTLILEPDGVKKFE